MTSSSSPCNYELDFSIFSPESSKRFVEIIEKMGSRGAEVILGCTEIPLLVKQEQTTIPLFDTTTLLASSVKKLLTENLVLIFRKSQLE